MHWFLAGNNRESYLIITMVSKLAKKHLKIRFMVHKS